MKYEKRNSPRLSISIMTMLLCVMTACTPFSQRADQQKSRTEAAAEQNRRERDEKIREETAKATQKAKPYIQTAARKLRDALAAAAEYTRAALEGMIEGWRRGGERRVDLNAASESELLKLPGISRQDARRIIQARPYRDKRELVSKGVLNEQQYAKIRDQAIVSLPAGM